MSLTDSHSLLLSLFDDDTSIIHLDINVVLLYFTLKSNPDRRVEQNMNRREHLSFSHSVIPPWICSSSSQDDTPLHIICVIYTCLRKKRFQYSIHETWNGDDEHDFQEMRWGWNQIRWWYGNRRESVRRLSSWVRTCLFSATKNSTENRKHENLFQRKKMTSSQLMVIWTKEGKRTLWCSFSVFCFISKKRRKHKKHKSRLESIVEYFLSFFPPPKKSIHTPLFWYPKTHSLLLKYHLIKLSLLIHPDSKGLVSKSSSQMEKEEKVI